MNEELSKKVSRAIKLIQSAGKIANEHDQPLEVCYSGGKDSDVILELAKMSGVEYRAIYKNTTIDPPGTIKHALDKGVEMVRPKSNFVQLLALNGYPNQFYRHCCRVLKEYKILDYAIIGIRRSESNRRANRYKEPEQCRVYSKTEKVRQYLPILEWEDEDIVEFINERNIKLHSLYYREDGSIDVKRRLGCMGCPLQGFRVRQNSLLQYPGMVKLYLKGGQKFLDSHKESKYNNRYRNSYEWFCREIFCNRDGEFQEKFGGNLFDDGIDCKKFLEEYFKIKL